MASVSGTILCLLAAVFAVAGVDSEHCMEHLMIDVVEVIFDAKKWRSLVVDDEYRDYGESLLELISRISLLSDEVVSAAPTHAGMVSIAISFREFMHKLQLAIFSQNTTKVSVVEEAKEFLEVVDVFWFAETP